jgi:hypothetical protein
MERTAEVSEAVAHPDQGHALVNSPTLLLCSQHVLKQEPENLQCLVGAAPRAMQKRDQLPGALVRSSLLYIPRGKSAW